MVEQKVSWHLEEAKSECHRCIGTSPKNERKRKYVWPKFNNGRLKAAVSSTQCCFTSLVWSTVKNAPQGTVVKKDFMACVCWACCEKETKENGDGQCYHGNRTLSINCKQEHMCNILWARVLHLVKSIGTEKGPSVFFCLMPLVFFLKAAPVWQALKVPFCRPQ